MDEKYLLYLLGVITIYIMFKISAKFLKLLLLISVGFIFFTLLNGCSTGNLNSGNSIEDTQESEETLQQESKLKHHFTTIVTSGSSATIQAAKASDMSLMLCCCESCAIMDLSTQAVPPCLVKSCCRLSSM